MKKIATFLVFALMMTRLMGQVNLQTGSATYGLPMFNWKDDQSRLSSAVALNYSSGNGLKVNEVASNVGQGWNLIAGGVITRMQVGEPDDQMPYYGNGTDQDTTKYPAGYLYDTTAIAKGCPNALTQYPIYGSTNQIYTQHMVTAQDKQQDYFSFQFNGKSGMFILDTSNGGTGIPLGDTKLKISFQKDPTMVTNTNTGIRTTITSFTIQDVDGMIYKFTVHGMSKILHLGYCDTSLKQEQHQPDFKGQIYTQSAFDYQTIINPWVIGSWYLSEIDDPLTQRKILFRYNQNTVNNVAGIEISNYRTSNTSYMIIDHQKSIAITQDIDSIVYPDGHKVLFNYSSTPRADLNGEYALASIDVLYNGRYLSEYQLNTSYFILNSYGTPITSYQKSVARLCLRSIKKVGVDLKEDTPPYQFDYYLGSNTGDDIVPPPFFYAKDIFGFYNGNNSINYHNNPIDLTKTVNQLNFDDLRGLCFLNTVNDISFPNPTKEFINPKSGYAKNGLLKQIIYPTGGTLTYQYSQNTSTGYGNTVIYGTSSTNMIGGVSVSQTISTDGGYSNGCANPIVTNYNYVLSDESTSSIWGLETPVTTIVSQSHYAPEYRYHYWDWSDFPLGICNWHFQYPGIISQQQSIDLTKGQQFMANAAPYFNVLSIIGVLSDIETICLMSSGATVGTSDIIGLTLDVAVNEYVFLHTCTSGNTKDNTSTVFYNFDLNGSSSLPSQFKRVEVVENSGAIGKTVQEFTSADDYPLWVPAGGNPDFSAKQRFAPWAYGLPKITTVFDNSGNMIKQSKNVYDFSKAQNLIDWYNPNGKYFPGQTQNPIPTTLYSCKCEVLHSYSKRNTDWADPAKYNAPSTYLTSSNGDMSVDFYGFNTGRVELDTTIETVFKTTDPTQYVKTITAYRYNSTYNYDVNQITTVQSNGDINYKNITYNSDYNTGILATLMQNNIFSEPVESTTSVQKATGGTGLQYLGEHVTEFTTTASGDIKPYRKLEQRFGQPVNSMTVYHGPGNSSNPSYIQNQILTYDASSNLTGMQDEGAHSVSNIYDYYGKYVVASVINAVTGVDNAAYSSFETSGYFGGWALSGTAAYQTSSAITGISSFILSGSNSFSATLNSAKAYTLSFWASNGNVSISGGTLVKSAPSYNGFTYYEYSIAQGNTSVTVSSSNTTIDELRLYPQNARMRSVTYDPLIGKTSECDENNRITYYQYDNLGRLRFIQDENKNVVKMYEYNNVSAAKQNGCPATYYNHAITEYFTKSNCTGGTFGNPTAYTVPAAKYNSTKSQADADAQAEFDLNSNGPTNANSTGTCSTIYYNTAQSRSDTTQGCGDIFINDSTAVYSGKKGGIVTYTVPANTYTSLVSVDSANALAIADLNANAQAFANNPAHAVCVADTNAVWIADSTAATQCGTGAQAGYIVQWALNVNPNSATYNSYGWQIVQASSGCPVPTVPAYGSSSISGITFEVVLTNTATGTTYSNGLPYSLTTPVLLYNVPTGTYNVSVYPISTYNSSYAFQIGGYMVIGTHTLSISGVTINVTSDASILIDPSNNIR